MWDARIKLELVHKSWCEEQQFHGKCSKEKQLPNLRGQSQRNLGYRKQLSVAQDQRLKVDLKRTKTQNRIFHTQLKKDRKQFCSD